MILHLLFDSGARASEITTLNLDYFNPQQKTLAILGKGNRFRILQLRKKTSRLLELYIRKYRISPKPQYQHRLFVNQRRQELTQAGLNRICKKYLHRALNPKRIPVMLKSDYKSLLSSKQLAELSAQNPKDLVQLYSQKHFRITDPIINFVTLMVSLPALVCRDPRSMKTAVMKSFTLTTILIIFILVILAA